MTAQENDSIERPQHVTYGVMMMLASMLLGLLSIIVYREAIGPGWVLFLFLRFVSVAFWSLFLIQIFHGKGWARYVLLALVAASYLIVAARNVWLIAEPFTQMAMLSAFAAIVAWFTTPSRRWFIEMAAARKRRRQKT